MLQALGPQILADLARNNLMGASLSTNDLKGKLDKLPKSDEASRHLGSQQHREGLWACSRQPVTQAVRRCFCFGVSKYSGPVARVDGAWILYKSN
jgi:hypothetical protein